MLTQPTCLKGLSPERTVMPDQTSPTAVGQIIPDAPIVSPEGSGSTLHAELAATATVIYFMRSATCPVCGSHVRSLARHAAEGKLGDAAVLIVVPGGAEEASLVARRAGDSASVWSSETAHALTGLHVTVGLQQSGTFVVKQDGTVRSARTATVPTGALDHGEVLNALQHIGVVA